MCRVEIPHLKMKLIKYFTIKLGDPQFACFTRRFRRKRKKKQNKINTWKWKEEGVNKRHLVVEYSLFTKVAISLLCWCCWSDCAMKRNCCAEIRWLCFATTGDCWAMALVIVTGASRGIGRAISYIIIKLYQIMWKSIRLLYENSIILFFGEWVCY